MKTMMTRTELNTILKAHKKWLCNEEGGERADLSCADLSDAAYNECTAFYALVCPEKGQFTGFKKMR